MSLATFLHRHFPHLFPKVSSGTEPEKAYDLWAAAYDAQPENLMLLLDEQVFGNLLADVSLRGRSVIDVGCGTGRHWPKILQEQPSSLTGYDVSGEMLRILKQKFPEQQVYKADGITLTAGAASCDVLLSTLALAHIPDVRGALAEWTRVLKPGGDMIITDYHPDALAAGGDRTFRHRGKLVAVKNHIHPLATIQQLAKQLGLQIIRLTEKKIDETVRPYYEKQQALPVYEKFKDVAIIYGVHLKKANAVT